MHLRRFLITFLIVCSAFAIATAQDYDREAYARDYIQFLVLQLDQWSKEFPSQFYTALMKPPVDATKVSEAAKAGPAELGDSIKRLAALSSAKDLTTNAEFRAELEKAVNSSKEFNQALSVQRFPTVLQSSWDQMRSTLNILARIYKLDALAVLEAPGGGGGRGGRGGRGPTAATASATRPAPPGGVIGYIGDKPRAKQGRGMWTNNECVARCMRDGDKAVLVTEDGKIYQISNQDKITPETYGQVVTLMGKTEGDTITVDSLKL